MRRVQKRIGDNKGCSGLAGQKTKFSAASTLGTKTWLVCQLPVQDIRSVTTSRCWWTTLPQWVASRQHRHRWLRPRWSLQSRPRPGRQTTRPHFSGGSLLLVKNNMKMDAAAMQLARHLDHTGLHQVYTRLLINFVNKFFCLHLFAHQFCLHQIYTRFTQGLCCLHWICPLFTQQPVEILRISTGCSVCKLCANCERTWQTFANFL